MYGIGKYQYYWDLFYEAFFIPAGPKFLPKDYPDLTGQRWVVTGATGGIGLATVEELVKLGAEVWMIGRNPEKMETAVASVRSVVPGAKVHEIFLDLADLKSIEPAVQKLKSQTSKLDGIIHNAGMVNYKGNTRTKQGLELTTGVNNVGPALLQDLLDPLIVDNPHGRIVWLSSLALVAAPENGIDFKLLRKPSTLRNYAMSKAWSYFQAVQWTHDHPNSPVKSAAVHPGAIKSDLSRDVNWLLAEAVHLLSNDVYWGATTVIYAALSPQIENGEFVIPFGRPGIVRPDIHAAARNQHGQAIMQLMRDKIQENLA